MKSHPKLNNETVLQMSLFEIIQSLKQDLLLTKHPDLCIYQQKRTALSSVSRIKNKNGLSISISLGRFKLAWKQTISMADAAAPTLENSTTCKYLNAKINYVFLILDGCQWSIP